MTVRKFIPVNPLKGAINHHTGMLVGHAVQHANANLARARPRYAAALSAKVDTLRDLAPNAETRKDEFYRAAREVGSDAGALGLTHMSQAALSLCDLLVSAVTEARTRASITVHVDAIMALRAAGDDAAQADAILRGLFSLSGRVA